ncbi:hypothetical protein VP01_1220g7 [Puccinia sorghi]|uniref:Pseudouridine synthase I TruA alpha/beta domain-containing protein n=1 Tax=Puccinia sorghi TaxID=27349 RepID=A0A0L6VQ27_9BASI|nr:hypothetical protein VP01_1220g7 [Puccinia sorghi]
MDSRTCGDRDTDDGQHKGNETEEYSRFSRSELIDQIKRLKSQLDQQQQGTHDDKTITSLKTTTAKTNEKKKKKGLDFDAYPKRKIALMISYEGGLHGGLAWQPEKTRQSTVEGELFRALMVARLVEGRTGSSTRVDMSDVNFDDSEEEWRGLVDMKGWGYSRAGRTDAGVSGCGQVVSLWVRSRLTRMAPGACGFRAPIQPSSTWSDEARTEGSRRTEEGAAAEEEEEEELGYHTMLNSILPASVRVVAWSPVHEDFDARFSCRARHYKYFFSLYETPLAPALNIEAMRCAASKLVGEHDFRNLCRIDPSKQLNNFRRRILSAEIHGVVDQDGGRPYAHTGPHHATGPVYPEALWPKTNRLFVLDLVGTAFLYNMVRHIMAVLFLVGSGQERPTVIERLLYTDGRDVVPRSLREEEMAGGEKVEAIDRKPEYCHASALPLLLYRCEYPEGSFRWVCTPVGSARPGSAERFVGWSCARIRAQLAFHLLPSPPVIPESPVVPQSSNTTTTRFFSPTGAATTQSSSSYLPVIRRPRAPHFSTINALWWNKVGLRRAAKPHLA